MVLASLKKITKMFLINDFVITLLMFFVFDEIVVYLKIG